MKKILFICIENSCRSQMAKGFFNKLTSSESSDSAGMQPADFIDPNAIKVMNEVGIDISHYQPKKLTTDMNNKFDIIVTMGCVDSCLLTPLEKTIEWNIEDPKGKSLNKYREVRDIIRNNVKKLITTIKEETDPEEKILRKNLKLDFHF